MISIETQNILVIMIGLIGLFVLFKGLVGRLMHLVVHPGANKLATYLLQKGKIKLAMWIKFRTKPQFYKEPNNQS